MKTKVFCIILLSLSTILIFAQSDYSKDLNTAIEKLTEGDCNGAQTYYNIYKGMTGEAKPYLEKQINDCKAEKLKQSEKKRSKIDLMDNSYCHANKNRYVAWSIAGAGYPWNLVTGIEFRGGGIVGVGLYGDIGMDFTTVEYSYRNVYDVTYNDFYDYNDKCVKVSFRYAGGIKFYPYKGLFIDCGYGTIATTREAVSFKTISDNDYPNSPDYYNTSNSGLSKNTREAKAKSLVHSSHGVLFHAGYNLVTDLSNGAGFFLGLSGGASYDVINKVFAPSVNLKIGVAWGWHK